MRVVSFEKYVVWKTRFGGRRTHGVVGVYVCGHRIESLYRFECAMLGRSPEVAVKSRLRLAVTFLLLSGVFLGLLVLVGFVVGVVVREFQNRHLVYATSERRSDFINRYSPKAVVERFRDKGFGPVWIDGPGAAAGDGFVTNSGGFRGTFAIRPDECVPLMTALDEDASAELARDGAQILARRGDPAGGFHYEYKLGSNVGYVTILPLNVVRNFNGRTPEGIVPTDLVVAANERWFRRDPGSSRARISEIVRSIKTADHSAMGEGAALPCLLPSTVATR
jgi:hypothetical protein